MSQVTLPHILTAHEYGYAELRRRARAGEIERVRRGAYVQPSVASSTWQRDRERNLARCVAASKRLTGLYAFSHATAASLFEWDGPIDPNTVEIVQKTKPSTTRQGDIRRHARPSLTSADIVEVAGLPVLARAQTVTDCARSMPPLHALITVDSALRQMARVDKFHRDESLARQVLLLEQLTGQLQEVGPGRHVARAREVLRYANGLAGSPRESQLRWLALSIGLPEPILEWAQMIDGTLYFSDLAWLSCADDWTTRAITFEYDGADKYGGDGRTMLETLAREKVREDAIVSCGVAVHRVMKGRLKDHAAAAAWILSKFPPSTLATLTPRPLLEGPVLGSPMRRGSTVQPR